MTRSLVLLLLAMAAPALADGPPAAFYEGLYRMIGIDGGTPVDEHLRVDAVGDGLVVTTCGGAGRLVMPGPSGDEHYIMGLIGERRVTCEPFSTYDNYPLLACYVDDRNTARLTLWPADKFSGVLDCGE